jgi:hypothetical protein
LNFRRTVANVLTRINFTRCISAIPFVKHADSISSKNDKLSKNRSGLN